MSTNGQAESDECRVERLYLPNPGIAQPASSDTLVRIHRYTLYVWMALCYSARTAVVPFLSYHRYSRLRSYIIALREILPDLGEPEDGRTDEAEVFMSVREGTPKRPYPLEGGEREEG